MTDLQKQSGFDASFSQNFSTENLSGSNFTAFAAASATNGINANLNLRRALKAAEVHQASANPNANNIQAAAITSFATSSSGQWHLNNPTGYDINIKGAWQDYSGKGVTVGIIDTGVDYTHFELSKNYNTALDYDFIRNTNDGINRYASDYHGTMVAGIIAAANNGMGTTGVAYEANITSFRLLSNYESASASAIVSALKAQASVDISNNSWGFVNPFGGNSLGASVDAAYQYGETYGRHGLGTVYVFAAGNSATSGGNTNYSELNNSRFVIDVGAVNPDSSIAYFSTPGSNVLISAPGSNITTTYVGNQFATGSGTSFAAPIVSGAVALMLQANANLGYRDVQEILAYSARRNTVASSGAWAFNGAHDWNGGGLHISEYYGFGDLDTTAAIRLAETWSYSHGGASVLQNETLLSFNSGQLNRAITDNNTFTTKIHVATPLDIEHAEVQLNMTHSKVGDLVMKLISPDGTQSILLNRAANGTDADAYSSTWSLSTTHDWGELGVGDWTLSIQDAASGNTGVLKDWTLRLYGSSNTTDNTYVYTNEYAGFTGTQNAARRVLTDTSGIDTINASAVTTNSQISLQAGSNSQIAGNTLTIAATTQIENAFGGDGNDTLTGNALNNLLLGGRGNDSLVGLAGDDVLDGGLGADTLTGGLGDDVYTVDNTLDSVVENANEGTDTVKSSITYTLGNNVEHLKLTGSSLINGTGNALNNSITGNDMANNLDGGAGNDTLTGGGGNDTLLGGDGNDLLDGGTGNDSMLGGAGNDTYVVDSSSDVVTELANSGTDTISSFITYTLGANMENLTLVGNGAAIDGSGNSGDNLIQGNSGQNNLYGNAGADEIFGDGGDDMLDGGDGNDKLHGGLGGDRLYGATGNDLLEGDSGNDLLSGQDGNDTLNGGIGNDNLYGGNGSDTYLFNKGDGTDTVVDTGTGVGEQDILKFGSNVSRTSVAFYWNQSSGYLQMGYRDSSTDLITLQGFGSGANIERFEANDGYFMTGSDINQVMQSMAAYAATNHVALTGLNDVKANNNLMAIANAAWHTA